MHIYFFKPPVVFKLKKKKLFNYVIDNITIYASVRKILYKFYLCFDISLLSDVHMVIRTTWKRFYNLFSCFVVWGINLSVLE